MKTNSKGFVYKFGFLPLALMAIEHAAATENFDLRYPPGFGGADMSAPLDPGWYFQMLTYNYKGKVRQSSSANLNLSDPPFSLSIPGALVSTSVQTEIDVSLSALAPRLTYMSSEQLLGATVGLTVLLPLVEKKVSATSALGQATFNAAGSLLPVVNQVAVVNGIGAAFAQQAGALSGATFGVGDLEFGPLMRWNLDSSQVLLGLTLSLPTGSYDKNRSTNPGVGDFYTIRPIVQYSYISDSWDFGVRAAYSINSRNRATQYHSGDVFNVDFSLMKSMSEQLRVGAAGYALIQTTQDTVSGTPNTLQALTLGERSQSFAVGPAVAWIKGTGEWLLEGRLLQEFSVRNRPKGTALWINLTLPLY